MPLIVDLVAKLRDAGILAFDEFKTWTGETASALRRHLTEGVNTRPRQVFSSQENALMEKNHSKEETPYAEFHFSNKI